MAVASVTPPQTTVPPKDGWAILKPRRDGAPRSQPARRYPCSICDKAFTRSEHRRRHELRHQNEKPYTCPACQLTSKRKDAILRHINKFHPPSGVSEARESELDVTQGMSEDTGQAILSVLPASHQSDVLSAEQPSLALRDNLFGAGELPGPSAAADVGGALNLDMTSDHVWPVASIANMQVDETDHQNAMTSAMDFQILDDYLFQWNPYETVPVALPFIDAATQATSLPGDVALSPDKGEYQSKGLFHELSSNEIEQARLNVELFDLKHRLVGFKFPSRYQTIRFVKAFFNYFLPHTPIVHVPTFDISASPAPLVLAVLAVGALHVNEPEIGTELHRSVLNLLAENEEMVTNGEQDTKFQLWEFQTRLLSCQFGLYINDSRLQHHARLAFTRLPILATEAAREARSTPIADWQDWIMRETTIRCVAWFNVLASALFSDDEYIALRFHAVELDIPLPCAEGLWASMVNTWQRWPKTEISSEKSFKSLLAGTPVDETTSPFGLLTLISTLLSYICFMRGTREAQSTHLPRIDEVSIETALSAWEEAWKRHPHSHSVPDAPHGPLMADAILILNTAYYHLYASDQLREMKALARLGLHDQSARTAIRNIYNIPRQPGLIKAVARATRSLLIRVRLGLRHLMKTASLSYACYGPLPAYEGGLLISWYLSEQRLFQNSGRIEPVVANMLDEIVAESEAVYKGKVHRDVLPLILWQDLIRERWVWHSANDICDNLGKVIQLFEALPADVFLD